MNRVLQGDCRDVMRSLIADGVRVQCVVTSPPYFGLRDYGTATWEGGEAGCTHQSDRQARTELPAGGLQGSKAYVAAQEPAYRDTCAKCGARRIDRQLGLEASPAEYVANMVEVFDLVRELLADDGTLWLNMGDSYAGSWGAQGRQGMTGEMAQRSIVSARQIAVAQKRAAGTGSIDRAPGLKPKDLVGIPWRLAFALQDAGWWLRQDIVWEKPNCMPESVQDRCTKSHEFVFLMTKAERYYFDADAIKEPVVPDTDARYDRGRSDSHKYADGGPGDQTIARSFEHMKRSGNKARKSGEDRGRTGSHLGASIPLEGSTRNKRSVWRIPTQPYSGAHFATMPESLVEPCILAGSRPGDIVFDPFMGSGTVARVAQRLGRRWLGSELNPEYIKLIDERTRGTIGLELA